MKKAAMKRVHISYKAETENFSNDITWYVEIYAKSIAEALNQLYGMEKKVLELVDVYER